ncbi:MAG TPA: nucleotidyl transferase AbiEii/AbiGii toxin family protein [Thermoanaerobaculia bacterium]|nr:nucleotidyl transferase AbiEii/AbiGii toxin family protein [Thermoanaerobaculia bacterium]
MTFDDVAAVLAALEREAVEYVLVGGVAVGLHGIERATNDIDLFIRSDESNVERLKTALRSVFDDPSIGEISAADLQGEYPTIRYGPPEGDFVIDILSRLGTTIRYEDLEAQVMEIEGVKVRVATPRTLYRMKRDTVRSIDRIDAANLREKFHLEDD